MMASESNNTRSAGISVGAIIAAVLSAALNHSFWWGLLHFFCGWFYVLYALCARSREILPALRTMF